jgi:uncharacterized RDD family membrane protein YckC
MDENQNTTQNTVIENPYETMSKPGPTLSSVSTTSVVYASFFERFVAVLIDGILVGIASAVVSGVFGGSGKALGNLVTMVLSCSYYVYFISQRGATIGKLAMRLRVQNEATGANLDVVSAILREVVGKFLSSMVLLLGYFWMLWDPKKQCWHDKIAKSVVVKVNA